MQVNNQPVQNTQAPQRTQQPQRTGQTQAPQPSSPTDSPQRTGSTQRFEQASQRSLPPTEDIENDIQQIDGSRPNPERLEELGRGGFAMGTNIRSDYNDRLFTDTMSEETPPLNTDSQETRLRDLEHFSQLDNDDATQHDAERCSANCLVAGMYYAEGRDGLANLIRDIERFEPENSLDSDIGDLRERLAGNEPIYPRDLERLSYSLYQTMHNYDMAHYPPSPDQTDRGISVPALQDFMAPRNPQDPNHRERFSSNTSRTFERHDMAISLVDTDGAVGEDGHTHGDHYVLGFQHGPRNSPTVYDPFPIRGEHGELNQVTDNPTTLGHYIRERATRDMGEHNYAFDGGRRHGPSISPGGPIPQNFYRR